MSEPIPFLAFAGQSGMGEGGAFDCVGLFNEIDEAEQWVNQWWEDRRWYWAHIALIHEGNLVVIELRDRATEDGAPEWITTMEGQALIAGEPVPVTEGFHVQG